MIQITEFTFIEKGLERAPFVLCVTCNVLR